MERDTMRKIRQAVSNDRLPKGGFTPAQVNMALGIHWAGTFLPKHRVGNPGKYTEHFVRIDKGLYILR